MRLAGEHADAQIALRFRSPLELLVSVMLSAQTTDVNVNRVTETLFQKYRRPEDYLAVPQEELERDIFATGFFRQKARSLRGTMRMLLEQFDGEVPTRLDELVKLLIWHGRRVCIARAPECAECVVNGLCPSSRVDVQPVLRPA